MYKSYRTTGTVILANVNLIASVLTRDVPDALCHGGDSESEGERDPHDVLLMAKFHMATGE